MSEMFAIVPHLIKILAIGMYLKLKLWRMFFITCKFNQDIGNWDVSAMLNEPNVLLL